jgi:hypothetical protein
MISVPGKIFLFGEYAVMKGGEAIVAAISPTFQSHVEFSQAVHPESPAGKFLNLNSIGTSMGLSEGAGAGFGSSTAELIFANETLLKPWDDRTLWTWYRERHLPASGADLAVQMESRKQGFGTYHFQLQKDFYRIQKVEVPNLVLSHCLVFQCPPKQKIPTHSDLERQKPVEVENSFSDRLIHRWMESFDFSLMTEWANELADRGYESVFAHEVRKAFTQVSGVIGSKGCGAGLNDVFIVGISQEHPNETIKGLKQVAARFDLLFLGSLQDHV